MDIEIIDCTTNAKNAINHVFQFCINFAMVILKFFLLLRKGFYSYEDTDSWQKCDETSIPPKESFYSELNLENIIDENYEWIQEVLEVFKIKNLFEYHDL